MAPQVDDAQHVSQSLCGFELANVCGQKGASPTYSCLPTALFFCAALSPASQQGFAATRLLALFSFADCVMALVLIGLRSNSFWRCSETLQGLCGWFNRSATSQCSSASSRRFFFFFKLYFQSHVVLARLVASGVAVKTPRRDTHYDTITFPSVGFAGCFGPRLSVPLVFKVTLLFGRLTRWPLTSATAKCHRSRARASQIRSVLGCSGSQWFHSHTASSFHIVWGKSCICVVYREMEKWRISHVA